jgi:hypothetical protein
MGNAETFAVMNSGLTLRNDRWSCGKSPEFECRLRRRVGASTGSARRSASTPHCVGLVQRNTVALKRFASGSRRLRTRACVRRGPDTGQTPGTRALLPATRLSYLEIEMNGALMKRTAFCHRRCSRARLGGRLGTGGRSWRQLLCGP